MSNSKILIAVAFIIGILSGYFLGTRPHEEQGELDTYESYATFEGGKVIAKDVYKEMPKDFLNFPKRVYEMKKQITLELAREKILQLEADKRKVSLADLNAALKKEHQNDPVTAAEFNHFLTSQGLNEKKLTTTERENFMRVVKQQKVMALENTMVEDIMKAAKIKFLIPEVK